MSRTDFPARVWEKWPEGWASREANDTDDERRRALTKILDREYEDPAELAELLSEAERLAL